MFNVHSHICLSYARSYASLYLSSFLNTEIPKTSYNRPQVANVSPESRISEVVKLMRHYSRTIWSEPTNGVDQSTAEIPFVREDGGHQLYTNKERKSKWCLTATHTVFAMVYILELPHIVEYVRLQLLIYNIFKLFSEKIVAAQYINHQIITRNDLLEVLIINCS